MGLVISAMARQVGRARCWWDGDAHKGTGTGTVSVPPGCMLICTKATQASPSSCGFPPGTGRLQILPARTTGCKEGRAGGAEGSSTIPCLSSACSAPNSAVPCAPQSSSGNLSRKLSRPAWLCYEAEPIGGGGGGGEKEDALCAGNLSLPTAHLCKPKLSPTLQLLGAPCSRWACREHKPVPSNKLCGI